MTRPVDDGAWVAGGILAAAGELAATLSPAEAVDRLASLVGPGGGVARWAPPDEAVVAAVGPALSAALAATVSAMGEGGEGGPVLRLSVRDLEALRALGRVSPPGARVVAHAHWPAGRYAWRWPLRVAVTAGVAGGALPPALDVGELDGHVIDGNVVDGGQGDVELLVAGIADEPPPAMRAACVVLVGVAADALPEAAPDWLERLEPGAVVVVDGHDLSWLAAAVGHLVAGRPLDVALGLAVPEAVVLADDGFLDLTAGSTYARALADRLDGEPGAELAEARRALDAALGSRRDAEDPGSALVAAARAVADAGRDDLLVIEHRLATAAIGGEMAGESAGAEAADVAPPPPDVAPPPAAPPPGAPPPPPSAPPPVPPRPSVVLEADVDRGGGTGEPAAGAGARPDRRRLQAQLTDPATKEPVADRFLPGANQVRVRVASEVAVGAVAADTELESPTPGRDADLTVEVIAGQAHAKRKLRLPAVGDSAWTRPVGFEVPPGTERFTVFLQVWFNARVIQSATLSGPVLAAGSPPPEVGLRLGVDASTPAAVVHRLSPADAAVTIVPGVSGEPVALTFGEGAPIESDRLAKANKGVRKVLLDAFLAPAPASLEEAARPLTRLAVRGRILYDALRDATEDFPGDDATWVQVSAFGSADLPLELVYTHPKPSSDDEVPVCGPALGGAHRCEATCPDRQRDDVVCPFGFWATSKVVERRRHVDDRAKAHAGSDRVVPVLAAGAAGVAVKADEVDTTASARILAAVKAAVGDARFTPLATWEELEEAVKVPARIVVLITHTVAADDDLGPDLQLGSDLLAAHRVGDEGFLNPGALEPGPVVIAIGCDTADLDTSYADYVTVLHSGGAELVVSAISPVPGKQVADFVERFFVALPAFLAGPGPHRFGRLLTSVRQETVAKGDVLALALTASGDADVALEGG